MMGESFAFGLVLYGSTLSLWSLLTNTTLIFVLLYALRGGSSSSSSNSGSSHGKLCPSYWWLVSNFTAVQLVTAGFILPLSVETEKRGHWPFGRQLCCAWLVMRILLVAESFWTLFAVTLDRFFGRITPLAYERYGRCLALGVLAVLGTWAIAVTVTVVTVWSLQVNDEATAGTTNDGIVDEELCATSIDFDHSLFIALCSFALPSAFTVVLIILLAAVELTSSCRRKSPKFTGFPQPATTTTTTTTLEQSSFEGQEPGNGSCLAVVSVDLCFIVGWAPAFATNVVIHVCQGSVCIDPTVWTLMVWVGYTTAGLAPLLWFLDPLTRLQTARILCRRRRAAKGPTVGFKLRNRRMEIDVESLSKTSISDSDTSKKYSELSV